MDPTTPTNEDLLAEFREALTRVRDEAQGNRDAMQVFQQALHAMREDATSTIGRVDATIERYTTEVQSILGAASQTEHNVVAHRRWVEEMLTMMEAAIRAEMAATRDEMVLTRAKLDEVVIKVEQIQANVHESTFATIKTEQDALKAEVAEMKRMLGDVLLLLKGTTNG